MNIVSARFANPAKSAVQLQTESSGAILVSLSGEEDFSGGWKDVYVDWARTHGTYDYQEPVNSLSVEDFVASQGYGVFQLLDLSDIEGKLTLLGVEKPPKAAAVRAWIDQTRLAFATEQTPPPAPHSYAEVQAEVLTLLTQQ